MSYKSIVMESEQHGGIVGTCSLQITCTNNGQIVGTISEMLTSRDYAAQSELIHRLIHCIESIAWLHECTHIVLKNRDVLGCEDAVHDLDYDLYTTMDDQSFFIKLRNSGDHV